MYWAKRTQHNNINNTTLGITLLAIMLGVAFFMVMLNVVRLSVSLPSLDLILLAFYTITYLGEPVLFNECSPQYRSVPTDTRVPTDTQHKLGRISIPVFVFIMQFNKGEGTSKL